MSVLARWDIAHSDGDDSPAGYVLLSFTRQGGDIDLTTMNGNP